MSSMIAYRTRAGGRDYNQDRLGVWRTPECTLLVVADGMGGHAHGDVAAFRRTVVSSLEDVIAAHAGQRVAVVCHGGVINAFASHLLGLDALFLFEPHYTSISRFRAARSGERSLASLNETAHLRAAPAR